MSGRRKRRERAFFLRWEAQGILAKSEFPHLEKHAISLLINSLELGDVLAAWECAALLEDKSPLFFEIVEWAAINGSSDAALRMRDSNRGNIEKERYWDTIANKNIKIINVPLRRPPDGIMEKLRLVLL